jgi:hypothetical protein
MPGPETFFRPHYRGFAYNTIKSIIFVPKTKNTAINVNNTNIDLAVDLGRKRD